MNKIKVILIIFLFFNLFFHVMDWSDTKRVFNDLTHKDEYIKQKVLVDSLQESSILLVESGSDIIVYTAYYKNPEGWISIEDNTNSIYLSKNEKPNIVHLKEYLEQNNDSIYIWHHPTLEDRYAKEEENNLEDSFIWTYILLRLLFFIIAILTVLYLIIKYIVIKKLLNKN